MGILCIFFKVSLPPQATVAIAWDVTALAVGPVTASVMVITCHFHWKKWRTVWLGVEKLGSRNSNHLGPATPIKFRDVILRPSSYPNFGSELWKGNGTLFMENSGW